MYDQILQERANAMLLQSCRALFTFYNIADYGHREIAAIPCYTLGRSTFQVYKVGRESGKTLGVARTTK